MIGIDDHVRNLNIAKDVTVLHLVKIGLLSKEDADSFIKRFHIVIYKRGWFKRLFTKDLENYFVTIIDLQDIKD